MMQRFSQPLIGAIVLLSLVAATVLSLTTGGLFEGGYDLTADFTDAAGLAPGDSVLVAGVRVGGVDGVEIDGDKAKVTFHVDAELPSETRAEIVLRNFLGKRALFLHPDGSWDALLAGGDHIPLDRTDTPVDFQGLKDAVVEVVQEQDVDALSQLIGLLADTTEGTGDDVGRLLDGLDRVTRVVADQRDELRNVIVDTTTVVSTLSANDDQIVTIIDEFGAVLERLAARKADIKQLLSQTARTTTEGAALLDDVRPQLDRVLRELHVDLEIVDAHQVDLAHFLAYSGVAFEGFANTFMDATGNPVPWQNVMVTSQGPLGVDALIGCGGALDDALDEVLGPDPRTCEEQATTVAGSQDDPQAATASSWPTASLRSMFLLARHLHDGGAR